MSERPLGFTPWSVGRIKPGEKTQTRRLMRPQPPWDAKYRVVNGILETNASGAWGPVLTVPIRGRQKERPLRCPYGKPGDLLVPRTTWATEPELDGVKPTKLPALARLSEVAAGIKAPRFWSYWDSPKKPAWCGKLRPGIFLPERFWFLLPRLVVEAVRAERLQEISPADVVAEGVERHCKCHGHASDVYAKGSFIALWDSIHKKPEHQWAANPWVWVVTFRMAE